MIYINQQLKQKIADAVLKEAVNSWNEYCHQHRIDKVVYDDVAYAHLKRVYVEGYINGFNDKV